MAVEPAVPGWYADPRGTSRYRYWDGQEWTGQVAASLNEVVAINRGKPPTPAPGCSPPAQPSEKQDWFDKLLPWLVEDEETGKTPLGQLLFFLAWVALTIFLLSGGC